MNKIAIFDAKSWIMGCCPGADALRPETLDVVSNFTLVWNLFENTLCNNKAKVSTFDDIAKTIAQRGLPDDVKAGVRFWANRYRTGSKFNDLFADLNFRRDDKQDHVEAVLSGLRNDPHSQLLAVMIIVYRLRNNLFHGLKSIPTLNDQVSNLNMACRALAAIVQASE
jgi:hypothetical protein